MLNIKVKVKVRKRGKANQLQAYTHQTHACSLHTCTSFSETFFSESVVASAVDFLLLSPRPSSKLNLLMGGLSRGAGDRGLKMLLPGLSGCVVHV